MSDSNDILEQAKEEVKKRGYNWDKLLAFHKAMEIAIECGFFDGLKACVTKRKNTIAVEAFVAGKKIGDWSSMKIASLAMNISVSSISSCATGKTHSAGRYNGSPIVWRYKK